MTRASWDDAPEIPPPSSATVDARERKPLLYLPDGRALFDRIGFQAAPTRTRAKVGE